MKKFKPLWIICLTAALLLLFAVGVSAYTLGDVDFDGSVTASDARLALRAAVGLENYQKGTEAFKAADADKDGGITASDARLILRAAVGLETLPNTPDTPVNPNKKLSSSEIYSLMEKSMYVVHVKTDDGSGFGSGFAIDNHGTIVTNYHVIKGAYQITAEDYFNKEYEVTQILAYDKVKDLAVLKINAATIGVTLNKSDYKTGERVYVLGSPKGYKTISDGLISNREVREKSYDSSEMMNYIQTSAPTSPGNSGGAWVDEYGRVIGVHSWARTDGQNLNFAIPVYYLDELDYSNPLTVSEFHKNETFKIDLKVYTKNIMLNKNTVAFVFITLTSSEPVTINFSSSTDAIYCQFGDFYEEDILLYVFADELCSGEKIRVYIEEYPSVYEDINVEVTQGSALPIYYPFVSVPDLGYYLGISPSGIVYTKNYMSYGAIYQATDLIAAGSSSPSSLRNFYFDLLIENGFKYTGFDDSNPYRIFWSFYDSSHNIRLQYTEVSDDGKTVDEIWIAWRFE